MTLTLKHLCQEFDLDPYMFRVNLRRENLEPPANRRWRWPDENDIHYKQCRMVAHKMAARKALRKLGDSTSS